MIGSLIGPAIQPVPPVVIPGPSITILTVADSPYTLKDTDQFLAFSLAGNMIVNLPTGATNKGRRIPFVHLDFNPFSVTFNAFAGENVDGQVSAVVIGTGQSYCGGELIGVGNDGIGFINGWHMQRNNDRVMELTAGPSITPITALMKLGSSARSIQPYFRGLYAADVRIVTAAGSPDQLQSYDTATMYNVAAGNIIATLNGAQGTGQIRLIRCYGGGANTLTLNAAAGQNIDGVAFIVMVSGQGIILVAVDATTWLTIATFP